MAGVFALGAAAAGGGEEEFEVFRDEGREVLAVEVAAGIDVHLVDEELVAPRGRGDLEGRHEREVGDGAVAGDEEEQVAAGGDLAGDALEVVARAVHEVEAGLCHRLGVIDHVVDAGAGIFLVRGAEGFEDDVVEAAKFVAGGGIGLGGDAVPREARGEGGNFFEEGTGGRDIARAAEKVGLGADDLVGLAEVARAAVADHLVHEGAGEGIAGYAGKRVGAAALEGDAEGGDRLGGARQGVGGGEPGADDALALGETGGEAAGEGEEMMRDVGERIAAFFHEVAEEGVGDGLDAVVDGEDGGDVRVRHETGETTEDLGGVVGLVGSAALGVRDGDDAVEAGVDAGERLEAGGELAGVAGGAGGGAEDDDDVARADAAAAGAAVALERARGGEEFDGRRGDESAFVQPERIEDIGEIGGGGEREAVDAADGEGGEHRGVAHVIAGGEVGEGGAEGEAPGEQGRAGRDGGDGEAVAFEHGVREGARAGRQGEDGAGIEATRGDGDVVAGGGESADGGESERGGRHGGEVEAAVGSVSSAGRGGAAGSAREGPEEAVEVGEFHGLREKLVHAGGGAPGLLLRQGGRGEGDDGEERGGAAQRVRLARPTADAARGFPAVEFRHVAVHQNHVGQRSLFECDEGFFAVAGQRERAAEAHELGGDDFLVHRVVLGHEHAEVEVRLELDGCSGRTRGERGRGERQGEVEDGALAGRALDPDGSAHELHEAGTDGEPEAGAAEAARRGGVGLGEAFEDAGEGIGLDADAGVAHFEAEGGRGGRAHVELHVAAGRRELDRVGDEIQQHLTEPVAVALPVPGEARGEGVTEAHAARGRLRCDERKGVRDRGGEVEGMFFQRELTGFDFGEVEDVAEQF